MGRQDAAKSHEGSDYVNTDLDCPTTVQGARQHNGAMLCESMWQHRREFQPLKVVAICDHLGLLGCGQPKHEILGETVSVSDKLKSTGGRQSPTRCCETARTLFRPGPVTAIRLLYGP